MINKKTEAIRVAVMGAGKWGRNVVRVFNEIDDAILQWVVDPDPAARQRAKEIAPGANTCESIEQAIDDVQAVAVCTPVCDHAGHVNSLLEAGKNVLVEKPAAMTGLDAAYMCELASKKNVTLMAGHQLLFHPAFVKLQNLLSDGAIGKITKINAHRAGAIDFTRELNVVWSYAPHDVAMILALMADLPQKISAQGRIENNIIEEAVINMVFARGIDAQIELDGNPNRRIRSLVVTGENGCMEFDDAKAGGQLTLNGTILEKNSSEPLANECRHFISSIKMGTQPKTGPNHLMSVVKVLEQVVASIG